MIFLKTKYFYSPNFGFLIIPTPNPSIANGCFSILTLIVLKLGFSGSRNTILFLLKNETLNQLDSRFWVQKILLEKKFIKKNF